MLIFIQKTIRLTEVTPVFYLFTNFHQLTYEDKIRVETQKGDIVHESISVADYLKLLPEV